VRDDAEQVRRRGGAGSQIFEHSSPLG
jgi:hypothetical protein